MKYSKVARKFFAVLIVIGLTEAALAVEAVPAGKITLIENGWLGEGVAFQYSGPGIPGCAAGPTHFAIDKNHAGYKEVVAIALAAYASASNVELIVERGVCSFGDRTKVISIRMKK
jgi:hypothetical protein